jgi:hypothetical protein
VPTKLHGSGSDSRPGVCSDTVRSTWTEALDRSFQARLRAKVPTARDKCLTVQTNNKALPQSNRSRPCVSAAAGCGKQ